MLQELDVGTCVMSVLQSLSYFECCALQTLWQSPFRQMLVSDSRLVFFGLYLIIYSVLAVFWAPV